MSEYNYSPWLLEAHKELVDKLITIAREGEQARTVFDDHKEARRYRIKILEILANLARNRPDLAPLRARLRTFIRYEGERYAVYVGVPHPEQKLSGAKPKLPVAITNQSTEFGERLHIAEEITQDNFTEIAARLAVAKTTLPNYIVFTSPPPPDGIRWIAENMAPEYEVLRTKPDLILERQRPNPLNASANDALPSNNPNG